MATDPNADEGTLEMGSSGDMKEKLAVILIAGPVFVFFVSVGFNFGFLGKIIGLFVGVISFSFIRGVILRKMRVPLSQINAHYEMLSKDREKADEEGTERAAKLAEKSAKVAKKTGKLTSGAISLIKVAGGAVFEKLEQRATLGKDGSPESNGSVQDDIAGRLEKLSNLHEQGHISDEEFVQQRSRILDEV
jgi:DNA-binding transcriptional MerR regulator